jgi:hypothetical protein
VTQVEECTGGICGPKVGNELGNLGKLLQDIGRFATDAAIFALAAEAIANPRGLADEVIKVVTPIADTAETFVRDGIRLAGAAV